MSDAKRLFAIAEKSAAELRAHLRGQATLTEAEVKARASFIRLASRRSFYFFAKVVLGFHLLTGQTHKKWCRDFQQKFLAGCKQLMRLKPRGTFKTTVYGIAAPLWLWGCHSPELRMLYTSANGALLDEVSAEIDRFIGFKSDSLYKLVFAIARDPDAQKNTADAFNIVGGGSSQGKGFSLVFRTAGGSTNGVHPHVIIVDDPMDIADRSSQAVRTAKTRWLDSLTPLLVPFDLKLDDGTTVTIEAKLFIATRWHLQDLVDYALTKDDWDVETESVFADDGVSARYPEFFGLERIAAVQEKMSDIFFACQYLNNPLPEGARRFDEKRLHFFRRDLLDIRQGSNFCFLDPSKGKEDSDTPAVVWLNWNDGKGRFFDANDENVELTALLGLIAKWNKEFNVKTMVFETNGAMALENSVRLAHAAIGHPIMLEPITEGRNKVERITAMQPDLYNGRWLFRSDWKTSHPEMRHQIINYPAWSRDDCPDIVEKAITWVTLKMPGMFGKGASDPQKTFAGSLRAANAKW